MSGNPTTTPAPTNVVPMPTAWPGPMFNPGGRSWPTPPSCFSELAGLNACYDSIQMMEQILAKVVCDLATNNAAFAQCLVEAIAKSGSNVPLIGVTNGADAQPGQVGEWFLQTNTVPITGVAGQTAMTSFTMQPGDWDVWAEVNNSVFVSSEQFQLSPPPAGMSDNMTTILAPGGLQEAVTLVSATARLLTSVPVLMPFQMIFNNIGTPGPAGNAIFTLKARRAR